MQLKRAKKKIPVMVEMFLSFVSIALEMFGLYKSSIKSFNAASLPDQRVGNIFSFTFQTAS